MSAKDSIEKEITCPLCLDIFQDPKRLPCDHIYCKDPCLQGLVLRSQNATIACPECRTVVQVPHNDVNNLPTAFQINRLKELYHTMQDKDETDFPQPLRKENEKATCATHVSQPIALYCETCDEVLCRDCVLKLDKHKKHEYGYIDEVACKQRKQIASQLKPAKELESQLSSAIENISRVKANIVSQGKTHLDRIDATFDAIINALTEEKELLKSTISQRVQQKSSALTSQEEELTTCLTELSNTINKVDSDIRTESNENLVHSKRKHARQIQEVCRKAQYISSQPREAADCGLFLVTPDEIRFFYKQGNCQYTLADPQKCVIDRFEFLETGKSSTAALYLRDFAGKRYTKRQDIQVELLCIQDNTVIKGKVSTSITGKLFVSVTPDKRGHHEISVTVNNFHTAGSPYPVYVQKPPRQLVEPVSVVEHIDNPIALFRIKDQLYVSSGLKNVVVLNKNREVIKTFECLGAGEMTIDSETEDCFVSDIMHHQLHRFNNHGRLIKSVGGRGRGPDHFDFPNGMRINRDGELFVCDSDNHRIKVYNKELELIRIFGERGEKPGCFDTPDNLAFDESGNLFVTEQHNHRVQELSPHGKPIRIIGKLGNKPRQLDYPIGIAIKGQYVFIIEKNNTRISVFTTQGEFVTTFGSGYFVHPECITIDRDGYVYVSDNRERIFVF